MKTALHALADSEHAEKIVSARSGFGRRQFDRDCRGSAVGPAQCTEDLRVTLRRVRQSAVARDPMVDQCTRMGFRALVISEKLTSDVEGVLFGGNGTIFSRRSLRSCRQTSRDSQLSQNSIPLEEAERILHVGESASASETRK